MPHKTLKLLSDILDATEFILEGTWNVIALAIDASPIAWLPNRRAGMLGM